MQARRRQGAALGIDDEVLEPDEEISPAGYLRVYGRGTEVDLCRFALDMIFNEGDSWDPKPGIYLAEGAVKWVRHRPTPDDPE